MGLVESSLKPQTVKPLVRANSITPLPSLSLDSCKFTDGSVGFLVTSVDLAKNTHMYSIPYSYMYSPADNTFVYVGKDESTLTFIKDRITGNVFCTISRFNSSSTIVRQCVSIYEPIDSTEIDVLAQLFKA